jgi:hypothetical protein
VIADESAFWLTENSANPDAEILNAVRPGLATTNGPLFLISSPYARRGELWTLYSKHFGQKGDPLLLVAQAASRVMNPSLSQSVVDRAMERDAASAAAEFGAEFRRDIESFVSIEAVQACVAEGTYEHAPARSLTYRAFADPSGGSSDSFTLAIAHYLYDQQVVVLDALRETQPPFSPEQVVGQYAELLKSYNLSAVTADRYAGQWVVEQFAKFGILCVQAAKPKSDLYGDMLALLNSRRIQLLDHPHCLAQLTALERRTSRGGRDTIDHPPNAHDDVANAAAGVASLCISAAGYNLEAMAATQPEYGDPTPAEIYRKKRLHPQFTDEEYLRITHPLGVPIA